MIVPVNYVAVLVAAIVAMVIGGLWYGPLFGKAWMKSRGMDPSGMANMKMPMQPLIFEFLTTLVTAFVIAEFSTWLGAGSLIGGIVLGLWIWLGFYVTALLGPVLWEKMTWPHYFIAVGVRLVNIVVMATIIGVWH